MSPATLAAQYQALRHGVGAYRWSRALVAVTGPDAASYLQGQCSQDLSALQPGQAVPSLLLEPDGKLAALVRVTRTGDEAYLLDTDAGFGEAVLARLTRFRLRTKVELSLLDWPCVALRGTGTVEMAGRDGLVALAVDWNGTVGVDLLGPASDSAVPEGAVWCEEPAWEALRVEAGIPRMGAELDGRTIAAEAGLVERTVSFTKGCYTGQELVARLDARGSKVARRLCGLLPLDADGLVPGDLLGAELSGTTGPAVAGTVTSAARCPGVGAVAGLGYVHRSVDEGAVVGWTGATAAGTARVVTLPLV